MTFPPQLDPDRIRREYLSAEQLIASCDSVWSRDIRVQQSGPSSYRAGDLVYAKIDDVHRLFERLRLSRKRIVLVTAEGDRSVDQELARWRPPQVAEWFSTNVLVDDPEIHAIPLGLANSYCQVTLKADMLAVPVRPASDRTRWLYVNFRPQTNPSLRGPLMDQFLKMADKPWITIDQGRADLDTFVRELRDHHFVLCPAGNGIDTHRMWEALYCGAIPIVQPSPAIEPFSGLPMLIVEDFRTITLQVLKSAHEKFAASSWNMEKLFLPWWASRLAAAKERLRATGRESLGAVEFLAATARYGTGMLKRRFAGT